MFASSSVAPAFPCSVSPPVPGTDHSVVWLRGEYEVNTKQALVATARAIALDESAVAIDLSEVRLMSAAMIGVIATAEDFVRRRGRSFVLPASSTCALSATEWCGPSVPVAGTEGPEPVPIEAVSDAQALGSWLEVPVTDPVSWRREWAEARSNDLRQANVASDRHGKDALREDSLMDVPPISEAAGPERH